MLPDPIVKPKVLTIPAKGAVKPISKTLDWTTLTLDPDKATVQVTQKWKYTWIAQRGHFRAWTPAERRSFHTKAEELVWSVWNRKAIAQVRVEGSAPQASLDILARMQGRWPEIVFDVQWVTEEPQWRVTVEKRAREMAYDPVQKRSRLMLPRPYVN